MGRGPIPEIGERADHARARGCHVTASVGDTETVVKVDDRFRFAWTSEDQDALAATASTLGVVDTINVELARFKSNAVRQEFMSRLRACSYCGKHLEICKVTGYPKTCQCTNDE